MSGVGSQFYTDLQKLSATHLTLGARHTGNSLQEILAFLTFSDPGGVSTTGRILGGLEPSIVGGTLNFELTDGVAAFKHAGSLTDIIEGFESIPATVWSEVAGATLAVSANASGLTRFDVVVVIWSLFTDRNLSMPQKTGPPVLQDTRSQPRGILAVIAGTPGGPIPTVGANEQALYTIELPDGTNAANFDSATTVKEASGISTFHKLAGNGATRSQFFLTDEAERAVIAAQRNTPALERTDLFTLRMRFEDTASPDRNLDFWPSWDRPLVGVGMPVGEAGPDLFPLVNPGGREWPRNVPFDQMNVATISAATAVTFQGHDLATKQWIGTRIEHTNNQAQAAEFSKGILTDSRGLQVLGGRLNYFVQIAPAAGTFNFQLFFWDQSFGSTFALTSALPMAVTIGQQQLVIGLAQMTGGQLVLDADDILFGMFQLNWDNSNDTAIIDMQSFSVDLREGRANP